ncbi:MAG: acyltransferase family protein [Anaerolineales bacterium]|nr:acyltransferase family protein [Anaerolineales bacterium]
MKRTDQLTFTRFAMVLLVLLFHGAGGYYLSFVKSAPLSALLRSAPTAVAYLYVLSGFVMGLVYFKPGLNVGAYWRARVTRIYPLYILAFALICLYYVNDLFNIKPQKILANLFVVQSWFPAYAQSFNYPSWSLTVEFFFYAVFPFFTLWALRRSTRALIWGALGLWAFSQLVHFLLWGGYIHAQPALIVYFPLVHLNSFILGAVAGVWYRREGRTKDFPSRLTLSLMLGSFFIIALYTVLSANVFPRLALSFEPMAGLLAPFQALFILALALDTSKLSRLFQQPLLVNLGEISYALYVLHVPMLWLAKRYAPQIYQSRAFEIGFLPALILFGFGIHFWFDLPVRKRFKQFLENLNVPLFLFDLAAVGLTAFYIFQLRFGRGPEYRAYREIERLAFWVAFFVSPTLGLLFGLYRRVEPQRFVQWALPVVGAFSLSSLLVMGASYWGLTTGWFENFPRSIFLMQWALVLSLTLAIRFFMSTKQRASLNGAGEMNYER